MSKGSIKYETMVAKLENEYNCVVYQKEKLEKLDDLIWTCYAHWRAHNEERMPYDSYPDFLAIITKQAKGVAKSFDLYPYNQPEVKEPNPIPKAIREEKEYEWLR